MREWKVGMKYIKLRTKYKGSILIDLLILLMINVIIMTFLLRYMYSVKNHYMNNIDYNRKYIDISCTMDQIVYMLDNEISQFEVKEESISYLHNGKRYMINKYGGVLRYIVIDSEATNVVISNSIDKCRFTYEPSEELLYIYLKSNSGEENFRCIKIKKEVLL